MAGSFFAAGETSYGEEGYSDTIVERILPVEFRVEEKWKDLSLIIVLDKSYSMYGRKIALAKEATKAALDLLEETHRFGVITFDWNPYTTIPLQLSHQQGLHQRRHQPYPGERANQYLPGPRARVRTAR